MASPSCELAADTPRFQRGTVHFLAGQGFAAELEPCVREGFGEIRGRGVGDAEGLPRLESRKRRFRVDGRQFREGRFGVDQHVRFRAELGALHQFSPFEAGGQRLELGHGRRIIDGVGIAHLRLGPARLRDLGFVFDNGLGRGFRRLPADQAEHLGHVNLVGGLLGCKLGRQVIVPVGETQTVLADADQVTVGVLVVRPDAHGEEGGLHAAGALAHQIGQFTARLDGLHFRQVVRQRGDAEAFRPRLVHEGLEGRADLAGRGLGLLDRIFSRRLFQDDAHPRLGEVAQDVERAVAGLVGRDLQVGDIGPVGEGAEIVSRLDRLVFARGVETPGPVLGLQGRLGRRGLGERRRRGQGQRAERSGAEPEGLHVGRSPIGCWPRPCTRARPALVKFRSCKPLG